MEDLLPEWSWSSSVLGDQTSNGCHRLFGAEPTRQQVGRCAAWPSLGAGHEHLRIFLELGKSPIPLHTEQGSTIENIRARLQVWFTEQKVNMTKPRSPPPPTSP
jgi:hypothetical protein